MRYVSLSFECPKCQSDQHMYLNISAMRKAGENQADCKNCGTRITVDITVSTNEE